MTRSLSVCLTVVVVLGTLAVGGAAAAAGDVTVTLSGSADGQTVAPNTTHTFDVVVDGIDGDLGGGYDVTVTSENTSVATVTDVTFGGDSPFKSTNWGPDNSSVRVSSALTSFDTSDGSATVMSVTVRTEGTGTTDLTVTPQELTDSSAEQYTVTETTDATITVAEDAAPAPQATVSLSATDDGSLAAGGTATYDVVASNLSGDVAGFDVTVTTGNASVATMGAVSIAGSGQTDVSYGADNTSVTVSSALSGIEATNGSATLFTVTATGVQAGTTTLTPTVTELVGPDASGYATSAEATDVTVSAAPEVPPVVGTNPPTNLDDDPALEDVDGDGEPQIADVIVYFQVRDSDIVQNNAAQFDFDGDGEAGGVGDVIALFKAIQSL